MKERPIIFSGPMVRAILVGRKTQTRRICKGQPGAAWTGSVVEAGQVFMTQDDNPALMPMRCPYGSPGDRLWVRETWSAPHRYDGHPPRLIPVPAPLHYLATEARGGLLWRPSIHMPRWASRITLKIVSVRVERLNDISEEDARAEGLQYAIRYFDDGCGGFPGWIGYDKPDQLFAQATDAFRSLWQSIHGYGSWELNPWVWVITFKRIT